MSKAAKKLAARRRMEPGYEGRFEVGVQKVRNPYDVGPKDIEVAVNARATGLDWLFSRNIIDDAQKRAGDEYRRLFERAELGGARAIDYSAVKVDTSGVRDPIDHTALDAANALLKVNQYLGDTGARVAEAVCCLGRGIYSHFGATTHHQKTYASRRTREVLDDLTRYFGLTLDKR